MPSNDRSPSASAPQGEKHRHRAGVRGPGRQVIGRLKTKGRCHTRLQAVAVSWIMSPANFQVPVTVAVALSLPTPNSRVYQHTSSTTTEQLPVFSLSSLPSAFKVLSGFSNLSELPSVHLCPVLSNDSSSTSSTSLAPPPRL